MGGCLPQPPLHPQKVDADALCAVQTEWPPDSDEHAPLRQAKRPGYSGTCDERAVDDEIVDIFCLRNAGYLLQYFSVGIIYGGLPATLYGFFIGYLNVPSYVYSTASVVMLMPWAFKFFLGLLNDCVPIRGLRRKPYMCIGWTICTFFLLVLATTSFPAPYWCSDAYGNPITAISLTASPSLAATPPLAASPTAAPSQEAAEPCNPDAQHQGGKFALLMALAALGYVIADVAADGLTVEFARREHMATRGRIQTTAYLMRTCGQATSTLLVGFGMNGKQYSGTFDHALSFSAICAILAVPSAAMIPISWLLVPEAPLNKEVRLRAYFSTCADLLRSKAFFYVLMYQFLTGVLGAINTTAGGLVKNYWAGVRTLQNSIFSLVGNVLFALGLALVRRKGLNVSWRAMLGVTTVFLNLVDMPFVFFTVFDVVRNQYFYLGETVLYEVPAAVNFVVSTYVMVEMAESGNEGLVYGLLTTTNNLGGPLGNAISNYLFSSFTPSLSDSNNYIADTPAFRSVVSNSFVVSYAFAFAVLPLLPLMPVQKAEAQWRKANWPRREVYLIITLLSVGMAFIYSVTVNLLSMFESTMCLKVAGGNGCHP